MLKSRMKSGMAGKIIVSSNITISPKQLRITSMLQPELWILSSNLVMFPSTLSAIIILHLRVTQTHIINASKRSPLITFDITLSSVATMRRSSSIFISVIFLSCAVDAYQHHLIRYQVPVRYFCHKMF